MTTPVQTQSDSGTMSFIMPSQYWGEDALKSAPAPSEGSSVALIPVAEEIMAVTVFGGYARGKVVDQKTKALLQSIEDADDVELLDKAATRLMQYNDPFTVPWKRRNEVAVPVRLS